MVWEAQKIERMCPANSTLLGCSPFAYVYLNMLVDLYGDSYDRRYQEQNNIQDFVKDDEVYDFIVVGAGSAGCIVANRLSAQENWKVLLLEAGPEEPEITSVPSLTAALVKSSIDWKYRTVPSPYACTAFINGQCQWPRGKTMGGSSAINSLAYVRGVPLDYDDWAAHGNVGWSYKDVLPYFIKFENNQDMETLEEGYYGAGGEQCISRWPHVDKPSLMFTDAFHERGLPISDPNDSEQFGVAQCQNFAYEGERASANRAFIRPIRYKRKNLTVRPNSEVFNILFDENNRAKGVKYNKNGKVYAAYATKEVIVSCGTVNSPKLLMLSGIGPKAHLDELGIPVIANLPVGENLHDHVTFDGLIVSLPNETATSASQEEMVDSVIEFKQMKVKRGPLSANGPVATVAFIYTDPAEPAPDIEIQLNSLTLKEYMNEPVLSEYIKIFPGAFYDAIHPRVINQVPHSRGKILLNASNPNGYPLIYPGYLEDQRDVERIIKGVRLVLTLEDTKAFKSHGARFDRTILPACKHLKTWGTDAYFECLIRSYTACTHHMVGSCKMGPKSDPEAVVDSRLRVYGVSGLRVIDASIMPSVTRSNTNAPALLIGERGVAFVLDDWLGAKANKGKGF